MNVKCAENRQNSDLLGCWVFGEHMFNLPGFNRRYWKGRWSLFHVSHNVELWTQLLQTMLAESSHNLYFEWTNIFNMHGGFWCDKTCGIMLQKTKTVIKQSSLRFSSTVINFLMFVWFRCSSSLVLISDDIFAMK